MATLLDNHDHAASVEQRKSRSRALGPAAPTARTMGTCASTTVHPSKTRSTDPHTFIAGPPCVRGSYSTPGQPGSANPLFPRLSIRPDFERRTGLAADRIRRRPGTQQARALAAMVHRPARPRTHPTTQTAAGPKAHSRFTPRLLVRRRHFPLGGWPKRPRLLSRTTSHLVGPALAAPYFRSGSPADRRHSVVGAAAATKRHCPSRPDVGLVSRAKDACAACAGSVLCRDAWSTGEAVGYAGD